MVVTGKSLGNMEKFLRGNWDSPKEDKCGKCWEHIIWVTSLQKAGAKQISPFLLLEAVTQIGGLKT